MKQFEYFLASIFRHFISNSIGWGWNGDCAMIKFYPIVILVR